MKFQIHEHPDYRLRSSKAIPIYYSHQIKNFAAPYSVSSPYIDILVHEYSKEGIMLRSLSLYVKSPLSLICLMKNPKTVIQTMNTSLVNVLIDDKNEVQLAKNKLLIYYWGSTTQKLSLTPGNYEISRIEFSRKEMNDPGENIVNARRLLERLKKQSGKYRLLDYPVGFGKTLDEVISTDLKKLENQRQFEERIVDILFSIASDENTIAIQNRD
ncbi:hypothetical protein [Chitinophaga filiformis]|uniref:Uncharacterized protein n=1 Tax=Chitinophaga filiformis TaxID=104663 RepID=A0ABY4HWA7_CHIFI|nr:hypothetical protein [Chitinophaga filiformis]UPK68073.1 hypothetical protein MYF79_24275 [Chitinophaga filiformis]